MPAVTLQVDDQLFARARELAAARHITVEQMLERLLHVRAQPPLRNDELSPNVRNVAGILPPMTDEEVRRALDEHKVRKYGST
jgi:hypothetical protein